MIQPQTEDTEDVLSQQDQKLLGFDHQPGITPNQFRLSSRKSMKLPDQTMGDVNFCYLLTLFMTTALGTI